MTSFVLSTPASLHALRSLDHLGSQRSVVSLLAKNIPLAVETLDHSQGFIWARALQQRDPQVGEIPPNLAVELTALLRHLSTEQLDDRIDLLPTTSSHLSVHNLRHQQNSRVNAILRKIRDIPEHE
jgi:hypothetical protein